MAITIYNYNTYTHQHFIPSYTYMLHGAGISTYMTGYFFVLAKVGIHIPAPWFAYEI